MTLPFPIKFEAPERDLSSTKKYVQLNLFFNPLKITNATKCSCKHPGIHIHIKPYSFESTPPPLHPLTPTCKNKIRTQKIENCFSGEQFDFEPACVDISDWFFFSTLDI